MKRLNVFLVVLLAVSCCVWALPGAKKTTQVATAESTAQTAESTSEDLQSSSQKETTATSKNSETSVPVSEDSKKTETAKESENLSQTSELNSKTAVSTEKLNELLTLLENSNFILGAEKIDTIRQTVEETVEGISSDLELNNALIEAQSGQIEALKRELKTTRFFADAGMAFGFKDQGVMYGVVGDMGIKFGSGLMTKVGVQYMLGDFKSLPQWSMENMTVSATIGWEW